jgi:hypothetical protein
MEVTFICVRTKTKKQKQNIVIVQCLNFYSSLLLMFDMLLYLQGSFVS